MKWHQGVVFVVGLAACDSAGSMPGGDAGPDAVADGTTDAGGADRPPVDAPESVRDGTWDGGAETVDLAVQVVHGPRPVAALMGVHVRAVGASDVAVEAVTGSDGVAHVLVPRTGGPWDVTAAREGYGAISVLGLRGPPTGPLRLDPLAADSVSGPFPVSGVIRGRASTEDTVQVDGFLFETTTGRGGFLSNFYGRPGLPLALTAIEADAAGNLVNAVRTAPVARPSGVLALDVQLPATPPPVLRSTLTIEFPASGTPHGGGYSPALGVRVQQDGPPEYENTYVLVGLGAVTSRGESIVVATQSFGGELRPDAMIVGLESPSESLRVNVVAHEFTGTPRVRVGGVRALAVTGTTAADVAFTVDADGYDTALLIVGARGGESPAWRCFTADGSAVTSRRLPDLPTGITPESVGLRGDLWALAQVVRMHPGAGAPWTSIPLLAPVSSYDLEVGGTFTNIDPTWRGAASMDAGVDAGGPVVCRDPSVMCSDRCVDLLRDDRNCGRCGLDCWGSRHPPGTRCERGACVEPVFDSGVATDASPTCLPHERVCGAACVDLRADALNCGACGARCPITNPICSGGICAPPRDAGARDDAPSDCLPPNQLCGARCIDVFHDDQNCGSCGTDCTAARLICRSGMCSPP